jgi:hypothetical protein
MRFLKKSQEEYYLRKIIGYYTLSINKHTNKEQNFMFDSTIYHIIYETTNLKNGKKYRGKHSTTDLSDGYLGSGKVLTRAIKKYGINNFRREILFFAIDVTALNWAEKRFVNKEWLELSNQVVYNLKLGGEGGFDYVNKHWHYFNSKRKTTRLEKYGAHNPPDTEDRIQKFKQTKLERFGDENYVNADQAKQTKLEKYGDENYNNKPKERQTKLKRYNDANYNNPEQAILTRIQKFGSLDKSYKATHDKVKQRKLEKYGDATFSNRDKAKDTTLRNSGYDNPFKDPIIIAQIKDKRKLAEDEKFVPCKVILDNKLEYVFYQRDEIKDWCVQNKMNFISLMKFLKLGVTGQRSKYKGVTVKPI